jgi:hypothetical protein
MEVVCSALISAVAGATGVGHAAIYATARIRPLKTEMCHNELLSYIYELTNSAGFKELNNFSNVSL